MNHEIARSLFMDYLYDEIGEEDRMRLEQYLDRHPELRRELEELEDTRSLLQQMPQDQPDHRMHMVEPRRRLFGAWWTDAKRLLPQSGIGKFSIAAAACMALFLLLGSATDMQVQVSPQNGFSMTFGNAAPQPQGLTAEQADALVEQIRSENAALIREYAAAIQEQNEEQMRHLVRYIDEQRLNDLQLIDQNLEQLYQAQNSKWLETNEFLGDLIQTVQFTNTEIE